MVRPQLARWLGASLALTLWAGQSPTALAQPDQEPHDQISTEPCRLGRLARGHRLRLRVTEHPRSCGRICWQETESEILDSHSAVLLSLRSTSGDDGSEEPRPNPILECRAGALHVWSERGEPDTGLDLRFDVESGQFRASAALLAAELDARDKPATGALAERRERLAEAVDAVHEGAPSEIHGVANELVAVSAELSAGLWLSVARDKIEAGAWSSAERLLDERVARPLSAPLAQRLSETKRRLANLRAQSQPLQIVARRRLGVTTKQQILPIEAGESPTLFWRRDQLCVLQEDAPAREMRCYSTSSGKWQAREALVLPASSGQNLKSLGFSGFVTEQCAGSSSLSIALPKRLPDNAVGLCEEGPGTDVEHLVAVVDGDAMLRDSAELDTGTVPAARLTEAQVQAAFARSAGGLLASHGCRFLSNGLLARLSDTIEQRWEVRGAAPADESWLGPPLVSPDRKWAVAQSGRTGKVTLWLFHFGASTG